MHQNHLLEKKNKTKTSNPFLYNRPLFKRKTNRKTWTLFPLLKSDRNIYKPIYFPYGNI